MNGYSIYLPEYVLYLFDLEIISSERWEISLFSFWLSVAEKVDATLLFMLNIELEPVSYMTCGLARFFHLIV